MITIFTDLPAESALRPLRELIGSRGDFSGDISENVFSLRLKPNHRKAFPVTISGHVTRQAGRTYVTVRAFPSVMMAVFFFIWIAFGAFFVFSRHSTSRAKAIVFGLFVLTGVLASALSFRSESRRAFDIIRRAYEV